MIESLFYYIVSGRELIVRLSVNACTNWLPQNKPRYVMGVGYPEDLLVSVALGADMFDCVWPTRTAVLVPSQSLILTLQIADNGNPISASATP